MLAIQDLRHTYPDGTRALDGVSLAIPPGILGLLGSNGAGKSTLMRCLAGLQVPSAGAIRFRGIDVVREPDRLRPLLGYLPQDFGVYPGVSTLAMVDHMAVLKGLRDRRARAAEVERVLRAVHLWDARHRTLAGLSGGMQRRFGVAQALLGAPPLLVVDEPTAGLDPVERRGLLDILAGAAERAVVILSTHIVEDAADLCSRIVVLAGGRVRCDGAPETLVAVLRGRVWERPGSRDEVPAHLAQGPLFTARLAAGRTLLRAIAPAPPDPGFAAAEPTLEDAYVAALDGADG